MIFVHEGALLVEIEHERCTLGAGDILSVPVGSRRRFTADGPDVVIALVTRRGDAPSAPLLDDLEG